MASKETLQKYEEEALVIIKDFVKKLKAKGDQSLIKTFLNKEPSINKTSDQMMSEFVDEATRKENGNPVYKYVSSLNPIDRAYISLQLSTRNLAIVTDDTKYSLNIPAFLHMYENLLSQIWEQFNELAKDRNADPNRNGDKNIYQTISLNNKIINLLIENVFRTIEFEKTTTHNTSSSL